MSERITLTLPTDVARRAQSLAARTGRQLAEVLTEAIDLALRPLGEPSDLDRPAASWTDEEVLSAADAQLPPSEDQRLSELLTRQQAALLVDGEPAELASLMQVYQEGMLRKSQGLAEAVRRGLREPPKP